MRQKPLVFVKSRGNVLDSVQERWKEGRKNGRKAGMKVERQEGGKGNWGKLIGFLTCQSNPGPAVRGKLARGIFSAICYKSEFTF